MATSQAAPTNNAAQLAALMQAGINPQQAQQVAARREFLAALLARMGSAGQNIRTPMALGANLLAELIAQGGYAKANTQQAGLQRQMAQSLFPNDQRAQTLFLMDPEGMNKAQIARYYTPIDVRSGNTVLNGPQANQPNGSFVAPQMHDDNGVFSTQTPQGVTTTPVDNSAVGGASAAPARPMNYAEMFNQQQAQTAAAAQAETARHNPVMEDIARQEIPIKQAQAAAALTGAAASAQNANTTQANSSMVAPPPGYVLERH